MSGQPAGARAPAVPLPHPSGASLWMNKEANRRLVKQALSHLQQAYSERESALVYTTVDPQFRAAWKDERYQELRRKMNLP